MSSKPGREVRCLSQWREPLLLIIVLSLPIVALLVAGVLLWGMELRSLAVQQVAEELDRYLHSEAVSGMGTWPNRLARDNIAGLSFVVISRDQERLLLADENFPASLAQELLHLELPAAAGWLAIPAATGDQRWAVVSRKLANGATVHGGRLSTLTYASYRNLLFLGVLLGCVQVVISILLTWYLSHYRQKPLLRLQHGLSGLTKSESGELPTGRFSPDEERVRELINRLVRQKGRLVDEMRGALDNVAHDLRTPLTRLRSVAEFGLQEDSDPELLRDSLAGCLDESERLLAMLNMMMNVAEAESGAMLLKPQFLSLGDSLARVIDLYEYLAEEKNITIAVDIPGDLKIYADGARIGQVWANLVDNAIKYGVEGGWLRVTAHQEEEQVIIRFADNGMGISTSEQTKIWERLYRGDRSRTRQGLGLGLNYVKAVIEAHQGSVMVVSDLNAGSCFEVALPLPNSQVVGSIEKSQINGEWSESRTSGI